MESLEIEETIKHVFLDGLPDIDGSTFDFNSAQTDYENWDSFAHLRLVTEIEKKFNLKLDMDDVIYLASAANFLDLVKKKLNP